MLANERAQHDVREVETDTEEPRKRGRSRGASISRIHITLPEELTDRIVEIQKDTYAGSLAEVIRNALIVYSALLEDHKQGREFLTRDKKNGELQKLAIFL